VTPGTKLRGLLGDVTVRRVRTQEVDNSKLARLDADTVVTENHAVLHQGRWVPAGDVPTALRDAGPGRTVVYAIETESHCADHLLTPSGLILEPWDGRGPDAWRPHSLSNGARTRCADVGSFAEWAYWLHDAVRWRLR
jgi:hypothetical protein